MPELTLTVDQMETRVKEGHNFLLVEPIFDERLNLLFGTEKILTERDIDKIKSRVPDYMRKTFRVKTTIPHYIPEEKRIKWGAYIISLFEGGAIFKSLTRDKKDFVNKYLKTSFVENDYVILKLSQMRGYSKKLFEHSIMTGLISVIVYQTYNQLNFQGMIDATMVDKVYSAGFLHDMGLLKFDAALLEKKRIEIENDDYNQHPIVAYKILQMETDKHELSKEVVETILSHEERLDGTGSPRGIKFDAMTFLGKLVGACAYFEMVIQAEYSLKPRPYREYIAKLRGETTKFDAKIVEAIDVCFKHLFQI